MRRVAAIDCGTNSIRLLIADVGRGQALREIVRTVDVVRLGQGVDRTGSLAPEALERTVEVMRRHAASCQEHGVEHVRFVATSATRDARNRHLFVSHVQDVLGVEPEVVSGQEEAALSFAGAVSGAPAGQPAPRLVVDIGGGSTEVVLGGDVPLAGTSVDIGSVRLTERLLKGDPPSRWQIRRARRVIGQALDEVSAVVPLRQARAIIGLAGSITTVTAHALRLPSFDRSRIDGAELTAEQADAACLELLGATRSERAALGFMHPGRVDVIGAGALIWSEIIRRVSADVVADGGEAPAVWTSEHDILDGIALSLA